MFDKTVTYHKSSQGADAITHRSQALTPRLRSMLILIDGKKPYSELSKLGAAFGDPEQLMTQLTELGFIEPEPTTAPVVQAPAPGAAPAAADAGEVVHPTVPLAQAQRYAVRRLTDILGPNGESLCLKIEAARSTHDFLVAVHKAELMLREFSGARVADQFAADMKTHRPA